MKKTIKKADGIEEVIEGTPEELADYEKKLNPAMNLQPVCTYSPCTRPHFNESYPYDPIYPWPYSSWPYSSWPYSSWPYSLK